MRSLFERLGAKVRRASSRSSSARRISEEQCSEQTNSSGHRALASGFREPRGSAAVADTRTDRTPPLVPPAAELPARSEPARPSSANSANSDQRAEERWRDVPTRQPRVAGLDDFSMAQALQREELRTVSDLSVDNMSAEEMDLEVQRLRQLSEDEELARALHDAERRQVRREHRESRSANSGLQLGSAADPDAVVSSLSSGDRFDTCVCPRCLTILQYRRRGAVGVRCTCGHVVPLHANGAEGLAPEEWAAAAATATRATPVGSGESWAAAAAQAAGNAQGGGPLVSVPLNGSRVQLPLMSLLQILASAQPTQAPVNRSATEAEISELPTRCWGPRDVTDSANDAMKQCQVCLEPFSAGEELRTMPCLHGFHRHCIDHWLRINRSCPICKHELGSNRNERGGS